jgi:drug/metabolite transporter superfamily protein YnfA
MLIQLISQHPQALGTIVKSTPTWVWGLLGGLLLLGASQLRTQTRTQQRVVILPITMFGLALYGMTSAFYSSGRFGAVIAVWLLAYAVATALVTRLPAPGGTVYNPASGQFTVPGSAVPMALILGIFLTKYIVGVELAMQPALASDPAFALTVALLYGAFSGIFAGRTLRLLRLVPRHAPAGTGWLGQWLFLQRDPW